MMVRPFNVKKVNIPWSQPTFYVFLFQKPQQTLYKVLVYSDRRKLFE